MDGGPSEQVRQEIAALISGEDDAWSKGDAAGFAAKAHPDIVFTNVLGMFSVGKQAFAVHHERILTTNLKGSTSCQSIQHITMVRPDVAIVDTLAICSDFQQAPPGIGTIDGAIHTRLEQVLVRDDEGWRIASFHNVAVSPAIARGTPPAQ